MEIEFSHYIQAIDVLEAKLRDVIQRANEEDEDEDEAFQKADKALAACLSENVKICRKAASSTTLSQQLKDSVLRRASNLESYAINQAYDEDNSLFIEYMQPYCGNLYKDSDQKVFGIGEDASMVATRHCFSSCQVILSFERL